MANTQTVVPEVKTKVTQLKEYFDLCMQYYAKEHKRIKLLDAIDRGDLWKALNAKFPTYQILPDTNFITYVKTNLLASLYTVAKSAELMPTSEKDKEIIMHLNIALDRIWSLGNIGFLQFQAGERAALTNMGITQVGWDGNLPGGINGDNRRGNVALKNIDPLKFMRDPFAIDLETAAYCMTYDSYHKSVFERNPNYKEKFAMFLAQNRGGTNVINIPELNSTPSKSNAKDYYTLVTFWVREGDKIHEIHTVNAEYVLYEKANIQPSMYPFAILYSNLPAGGLVGTSECAKICASNVAMNIMDSTALTAEYKNQRPPKFVSNSSGLNIQTFAKHGDEADKTFVVNGDASKAVHFQQFPFISPIFSNLKMSLEKGMEQVSGVDGRYTGRDTGSIITTGGTEEMLNRVTLIDTPKIINYENYAKTLSKLILSNFIRFAPSRKYLYKKPNTTEWITQEVNFPDIDNDAVFDYQLNISSELPKNKQRLEAMANTLMEKQMQYQQEGGSVDLITQEEWLMMLDIPNKEYMLERMGIQRLQSASEDVSQVLFQYAELVKQGMDPQEAILATADSLNQQRGYGQQPVGPIPGAAPEGQMPMPGMPGMMPGMPGQMPPMGQMPME